MFTGLVQHQGRVDNIVQGGGVVSLAVHVAGLSLTPANYGESIAVDGVCLTLVRHDGHVLWFDLVQSTIAKSSLAMLKTGDCVNIETSKIIGAPHGGHDISGHVDFVARVAALSPSGASCMMVFEVPSPHIKYFIRQGFVAINGCSITVNSVDRAAQQFSVWLIPETMQRTNLGALRVGDVVNIEVEKLSQLIVDTIEAKLGAGEAADVIAAEIVTIVNEKTKL